MKILKAIWKLTRFEHALMLAFAVFVGATIAQNKIPIFDQTLLLALLVPIFSEMGSFALNDILDVETDRKNGFSKRPLVSGEISIALAWAIAIGGFVISTMLAFFLGAIPFGILIIFNLFAILYNYKLKDLPLLGNIYIGTTMAIPFIFGNFSYNAELNQINAFVALLGFLAGVAREIIKSTEDMQGDKEIRNSKTLPILIGEKNAIKIAIFIYLIACFLVVLPFSAGLKVNLFSIGLLGVCELMLMYIVYLLLKKEKSYRKARNLSLIAFGLGMTGILAGIAL